MREIKFRGITNEFSSPRWVYGDLICDCTDEPRIMTDYHDCYDPVTWTVDPATVGQFTGMLDCEGREIYEGDLLEYKTWADTGERYLTMGEVRFLQGQFLVVGPKDIEVQGLFSVAHEPALSDVRVIGNVHDNPDLLEVEHD